jgi:hypothetical protein
VHLLLFCSGCARLQPIAFTYPGESRIAVVMNAADVPADSAPSVGGDTFNRMMPANAVTAGHRPKN